MSNETLVPLFPSSEVTSSLPTEQSTPKSAPRLRLANRSQLFFRSVDLDGTIPPEHEARSIWRFVEQLDVSRFLETIEAREGEVGRDATDPKILLALWLYATSEAVGSARALARLCESHDAYRWICGGVSMNHHTLSDFRIFPPLSADDPVGRSRGGNGEGNRRAPELYAGGMGKPSMTFSPRCSP